MIRIDIPGQNRVLNIEHLLLDANGTLTLDGQILPGVKERLDLLKQHLQLHLLTADTFGKAGQLAEELGINWYRVDQENGTADKQRYLHQLQPSSCAAIGNGYNDHLMLADAALSVAVIGPEGCAVSALQKADIAVNSVNDALDLLLNSRRITATLRL